MTQNKDSPGLTAVKEEHARLLRKYHRLSAVCYATVIVTGMVLSMRAGTLFSALLVLFGLIISVVSLDFLRRRLMHDQVLRLSRGRCIKCNYDLSGLSDTERCPECGTAVYHPPGLKKQ